MADPRVTININADEIINKLKGIEDTVLTALAKGLNDSAFDLRRLWQADIKTFVNRPTSFTRKIFVNKATPGNLVAITFLPRIQSEYLRYIVDGGVRRAGEIATLGTGDILQPVGARLTAAGNLPRGGPRRWLATLEEKIKGGFVGNPGGREGGEGAVYQRLKNNKLKLLAVFERNVKYEQELPLEKTAELFVRTADQKIQNALNKFLQ